MTSIAAGFAKHFPTARTLALEAAQVAAVEKKGTPEQEVASDFGKRLLAAPELSYSMVRDFQEIAPKLSDGAYWGFLGALFLALDNEVDNETWRLLFAANRRERRSGLMRKQELHMLKLMPAIVNCYRAHTAGETDWLLAEPNTMDVLSRNYGRTDLTHIGEYTLKRKDVAAIFTRRGRIEILCLDVSKFSYIGSIPVNLGQADDGGSGQG
jgi:hypothetical protein